MKLMKNPKRISMLLLAVSLAFVGSLAMLMTMSNESTLAQEASPIPQALCDLGLADCTPTPGADMTPEPEESPVPQALCDLGLADCTPTPNAAATAQANADMTATAVANAAATAQANADATATAEAGIAAMTVTAEANAAATAQVNADATATAAARITRTAIAQKTVTAGGVPAPAPRATATPVHIEKADVTAVEGATTVEPDMQVELMAGNVSVKFPTLSRDRTYQAMVSESDDCGDMAMACAMVSIYNAEGEMESDARLISAAEITITLDADAVSELGAGLDGGAVALQANALGGVMLQLMDDASGEWNSIPFDFMVNSDGSVTVTAMTRRFSVIALNVYADVVEQARMQVSMALGTPTATPIPTATPVPPTPVPPTPTPVPPTPTPEPVVAPDTGDTSVPFLMLLAMAFAASMLALIGTKVIMARVRR